MGAVWRVEAFWEDDDLCSVLSSFEDFDAGIVEIDCFVVA